MKRLSSAELLPAQAIAQRMQALQAELQQARHHLRRERRAGGPAADRWGLEPSGPQSQEEGWFVTYLDMMTLLLVVMIVMLAFSGAVGKQQPAGAASPLSTPVHARPVIPPLAAPAAAPAPDPGPSLESIAPFPYPAISGSQFERMSGMQSLPAIAPLAGTFAEPSTADVQDVPAVVASTQLVVPSLPVNRPSDPDALGTADDTVGAATDEAQDPNAGSGPGSADADLPQGGGPALMPPTNTPPTLATVVPPSQAASAVVTPGPHAEGDGLVAPEAPTEGQSLAASLPLGELGRDVEVIVNKRSVSFRVNSEILFDSAQTDLSRAGLAVLRRMAHVLVNAGYDVTVEGHTDSVPVRSNARFPSNWELSSARAGSVVRYLQANGISRSHLKAVGLADAHPIADNRSPEGRARNRRVELVVAKHRAP